MANVEKEYSVPRFEEVGTKNGEIPVQLSARFLEHFSEQLYSSPNKAFEELVSNSWDAGAQTVYIEASDDFPSDASRLYIIDDGYSMTEEGLKDLWKVASSPKENEESFKGRSVIGRFGIGKLSTYVLAEKLTYVCKASDGVIRAVTMDYSSLERDDASPLIGDMTLDLRVIQKDEVVDALLDDEAGKRIRSLIENGFPTPSPLDDHNREFGESVCPVPEKSGCWTLVVLSGLKGQGKRISFGHIRRMLSASLPLGSDLGIYVNDERVVPSKIDKKVMAEWLLGADGDIEFSYHDENNDEKEGKAVALSNGGVDIPGIGKVTGRFKIYEEKITGGKSDFLGASNGFHVNILGRVINDDVTFGDKDFSHSVWARFRMTVRADGLNSMLAVNREQLFKSEELLKFRGFLRKCFNLARRRYNEIIESAWSDTGKNIVQAWGTLPLKPFRSFIEQYGAEPSDVGDMFEYGDDSPEAAYEEWEESAGAGMEHVIEGVDFQNRDPGDKFARYSLKTRSVVINASHPFAVEHAETAEEKRVLRNVALLDLLTDAQAFELGITPTVWNELREYKDNAARLIAKLDRKSGVSIATTLREVSTYKDYRAFEILVSEALEYLGFVVEKMGGSGEPEGVARAYPTPSTESVAQSYCFTYDAKSSISGKVKTGNVGVAGLARHKRDFGADHSLVVAPQYEDGGLRSECEEGGVTPICAADLGELLTYTARFGAIPLITLREVFEFRDPHDVHNWVEELEERLVQRQNLTLDTLIEALKRFDKDLVDPVAASHLATVCWEVEQEKGNCEGRKRISKVDVLALVRGLGVIAPDAIREEGNAEVVVGVHPERLAQIIQIQLQKLDVLDED